METLKLEREDTMNWTAYCITCRETLECCPNGHFAEGAARAHKRGIEIDNGRHLVAGGTSEHVVIVGYIEIESN
jgi:hypothetical protein